MWDYTPASEASGGTGSSERSVPAADGPRNKEMSQDGGPTLVFRKYKVVLGIQGVATWPHHDRKIARNDANKHQFVMHPGHFKVLWVEFHAIDENPVKIHDKKYQKQYWDWEKAKKAAKRLWGREAHAKTLIVETTRIGHGGQADIIARVPPPVKMYSGSEKSWVNAQGQRLTVPDDQRADRAILRERAEVGSEDDASSVPAPSSNADWGPRPGETWGRPRSYSAASSASWAPRDGEPWGRQPDTYVQLTTGDRSWFGMRMSNDDWAECEADRERQSAEDSQRPRINLRSRSRSGQRHC